MRRFRPVLAAALCAGLILPSPSAHAAMAVRVAGSAALAPALPVLTPLRTSITPSLGVGISTLPSGPSSLPGPSLTAPQRARFASLLAAPIAAPIAHGPAVAAVAQGPAAAPIARTPVRASLSRLGRGLAEEPSEAGTGRQHGSLNAFFDSGARPADEAKSLILVQIDGLGNKALLEAMEKGYTPNLAALAGDPGFRLTPFLNGIPTVTMAIQTEMFYGKLAPGNEWYSKARGREITATEAERDLSAESGLLHGGRVYLSELSGGASKGADVRRIIKDDTRRMGTVRAVLKELMTGGPLFARYLLVHNPLVSIPRFLYHTVRDVIKMKRDFKKAGFTTKIDKQAPYFFSLTGNLWSNIAMEGLKRAVRKKVPVAYADFSTYDEFAHYYGASAKDSFESLRKIDKQVGEVARVAKKNGAKLIVFSDHGQTPSRGFIAKYGMKAQELVDKTLAETVLSAKPGELAFSHVYSMGNIYVKDTPGHVELDAFRSRYPGFVEKLLEHPGIGTIAARRDGGVEIMGPGGTARISLTGKLLSLTGKDPLEAYADKDSTADKLRLQLINYIGQEEAGDLVVFAPYANGKTLDYNSKYTLMSEHGGIGGEQMHPFVLYDPSATPMKPEGMLDARGFYRALIGPVMKLRRLAGI